MTRILGLFAILITFSFTAAAAPLAKKLFTNSEGEDAPLIQQLFKEEAARKGSPIHKVISKLEKEIGGVETGDVSGPEASDILPVYSGRSGLGHYGASYIVGIRVSMKGTGLITYLTRFMLVNASTDMAKGTTITFEKFLNIATGMN